jgi:hypothetical protein
MTSSKSRSVSGSIIAPIIFVVILAIDIYILVTGLQMQKSTYECKCAQVWHLKQITNTIITIISFQLAIFVLGLINIYIYGNHKDFSVLSKFIKLISLGLFIAQLYYIIMLISLIAKLDNIKCLCVDPKFKTFLTYYTGFRALFAGLLIIILAIIIVSKISNRK